MTNTNLKKWELWAALKVKLLTVPPETRPMHFYGRTGLYAILFLWGVRFIATDYDVLVDGYPEISDSFLHDVNLIFHEAGHVLFLPLGRFMSVLGGTLNQWLIPSIVTLSFLLKTRDTFGASVGLWWLGQSLMDAAPYINDARAGRLILLGGGTGRDQPGYHDWENILGDLGWLKYDHLLASMVDAAGVATIVLALAWGAFVLSLQYKNLPNSIPPAGRPPAP